MRVQTLVLVTSLALCRVATAQSTSVVDDATAAAGSPTAVAGVTADASVFTSSEPARALKAGKILHARRILGEPPAIDGRLNEEIWAATDVATDLLQRDPDNGRPMTEATRVQVAYDDRFLYVAVTCVDADARSIARGLGRRDERPQTDYVTVAFDPRHDHLTGYAFETNPSAWQGDYSFYDDDRTDRDYNANWDVRAQITDAGWTAEFRIPFSQMRFSTLPSQGQVWGFNVGRQIRRKNEFGTWVPRPRGERGDVSLFGHLVFDSALVPPGRLEITPYALSRAERDARTGSDFGLSAGADMRYGLGTGATLSATINPDFGQVEQDPAVLNLSIYETFFPEKRPFFLEDSRTFVPPYSLFQLFHSRRIGRTPDRFAVPDGTQIVEQPADTTILGAAKLTGKNSQWTYGALTALTSREYASVDLPVTDGAGGTTTVTRGAQLIEPATSYNVARVQRDLRGSSNIGAIVTGVMREKDADAFAGGLDYNLRFDRNRTSVNGQWAVTHAPGDGGVKNGFAGLANINYGHKHVNANLHFDHVGNNFRVTDLGFLRTRTNRNRVDGNIEVGQPDPGKHLRSFWFGTYGGQAWNDERLVFERNLEGYFAFQLLNFWRGNGGTGHDFARMDDRDTRGGPPIAFPAGQYAWFHLESDVRKSWQWTLNVNGGANSAGSRFHNLDTGINLQPSDRIQTSLSLSYRTGRDDAQWIRSDDVDGDGIADYVYGTLRRHVVDLRLRATYAFTRDLTLQAYMQPFVAVGAYTNTRKLALPRSYVFEPVTVPDNPDFNSKSLRSNVVLRWEYQRGSTLYVVWNLSEEDASRPGVFSPWRDLGGTFHGPATNVVMVKASYWINR